EALNSRTIFWISERQRGPPDGFSEGNSLYVFLDQEELTPLNLAIILLHEVIEVVLINQNQPVQEAHQFAQNEHLRFQQNAQAVLLPGLTWGFYVFEIPESQVGGIADVAKGLPEATLRAETTDGKPNSVFRVTPYYREMQTMTGVIKLEEQEKIAEVTIPYQDGRIEEEIYKRILPVGLRDYLLVGSQFSRAYDKSDRNNPAEALKEIIAFNVAAAVLVLLGETPVDIPFLADWQAGLMLAYLQESVKEENSLLRKVTVKTQAGTFSGAELVSQFIQIGKFERIIPICWINNEAYRGEFEISDKGDFTWKTGLVSQEAFERSRWITPERQWEIFMIMLKLAAESTASFGGEVITVSGPYAQEIMGEDLKPGDHPGMLHGILRRIGVKGVLNGTPEEWRYVNSLSEKNAAKPVLQERLGLGAGENRKTVYMVCRLVSQKGISLVVEAKEEIAQALRDYPDVDLIIGGKPEKFWEEPLKTLKQELETQFPTRARIILEFLPEDLVRLLYLTGDINLFPSLYEPCGTLAKVALNMGITLARLTGGIKESAVPIEGDYGNAVVFEEYSPEAFMRAFREALELTQDAERFARIQERAPQTVVTWDEQFVKYAQIIAQARIQKGLSLDTARSLPGQPMPTEEETRAEIAPLWDSYQGQLGSFTNDDLDAAEEYLRTSGEARADEMLIYLRYVRERGLIRAGPGFRSFLGAPYRIEGNRYPGMALNSTHPYHQNPVERVATILHEAGAALGIPDAENAAREERFKRSVREPDDIQLEREIGLELISMLEAKHMPTKVAREEAIPVVLSAINRVFSGGDRCEAYYSLKRLGANLITDGIPVCTTLQYGVPLAVNITGGHLPTFKDYLIILEQFVRDLYPINPYQSLLVAILYFGNRNRSNINFRNALD
ncbi:MAG: glycosyltransferase, partial [Candidatus Omnitrophota bacterium]